MSQIQSPQLIESLRQYDSATVANAIEHFEVRDPTMGYANNELVCQMPEIGATDGRLRYHSDSRYHHAR